MSYNFEDDDMINNGFSVSSKFDSQRLFSFKKVPITTGDITRQYVSIDSSMAKLKNYYNIKIPNIWIFIGIYFTRIIQEDVFTESMQHLSKRNLINDNYYVLLPEDFLWLVIGVLVFLFMVLAFPCIC